MVQIESVTYAEGLVELQALGPCSEFPRVHTVVVKEEDMTPYTERRNAGHYDPKPVKTPAAEKSTTTEKLSGLTQGGKKSAKK